MHPAMPRIHARAMTKVMMVEVMLAMVMVVNLILVVLMVVFMVVNLILGTILVVFMVVNLCMIVVVMRVHWLLKEGRRRCCRVYVRNSRDCDGCGRVPNVGKRERGHFGFLCTTTAANCTFVAICTC